MRDNDRTVRMREFTGLQSNADPQDIPPGAAQVQRNITSIVPGQLETRRGMREVEFEN